MHPGKGGRDRLHLHVATIGQHRFGGAQKRALERQHAVAGVAGAFGEQHQRVACDQPVADGVAGFAGGAAAVAVDEHGALQPRQRAEEGPLGHFRLGHERDRRHRREDDDVGPACVIGDQQHAFAGHRLARHLDMDAEQRGDGAVIEIGKAARRVQPQFQQQPLHRHADQRDEEENRRDDGGAQPRHQFCGLRPLGTPYSSRRWSISSKPSSSATRRCSFSISSLRNSMTLPVATSIR